VGRWEASENREEKIRELGVWRLAVRGRDTWRGWREEKIKNQLPRD